MKNAVSFILTFVIVFAATIFASAEDKSYDVLIETAEVLIVDDDTNSGGFSIRMTVPELEKYKYVRVNVDFNTDIIKHGVTISQPLGIYSESCVPTETGISFYVAWNENSDRKDGYSYSGYCDMLVTDFGQHNMTVTAEVRDLNGNDVDVKIKFNTPYERVVKKSEAEFVEFKENYTPEAYRAVFEHGTDVKTVLSKVKAKNVAVIDKNGKILSPDDKIPNDADIITLFEGYRVDSFPVLVPYDVTCDGEVTAADARLALRAAAKIEYLNGTPFDAADVDGQRGITAADARKILRVAANLEKSDNPEKAVIVGEEFVIEKLKNAGSGAYNWKCTVSDESAFEITDTIAPPEGVEINPGTPFEQTFTFKALKTGVYDVHFELIRSWETEPIKEFGFTVIVDDIL